MRQIILASQSPQRKSILETLGVPFEVVPAGIDEQTISAPTPYERAVLVASAKAEKIHLQYPDAIIIAGDTFVLTEGKTLEKPKSLVEAAEMLAFLSGKTIEAVSGVCYLDPLKHVQLKTTITTKGTFRKLSPTQIQTYINRNPVLTWSGGFSPAYTAGMGLIASVEGSFTNFAHGLPIEVISDYLIQSGIEF